MWWGGRGGGLDGMMAVVRTILLCRARLGRDGCAFLRIGDGEDGDA